MPTALSETDGESGGVECLDCNDADTKELVELGYLVPVTLC